MVKRINRLPYKAGVIGLISGFTSLSDETKLWPRPLMLTHHSCMLGASVVKRINRLPYKAGVIGLISGFTSLSDETKLWPRPHMI